MKQQTQRPVRRIDQQRLRTGRLLDEDWPRLTALADTLTQDELLNLPLAELLSRRNRIRSMRLAPPDQAA